VTQGISNPHDKLFKQLLGEPENAADFTANNPGVLGVPGSGLMAGELEGDVSTERMGLG
jgi:hypothetical protein